MEPEEIVAFASLVYFYNERHDIRYNGRILCARVAPALVGRSCYKSSGFFVSENAERFCSNMIMAFYTTNYQENLNLVHIGPKYLLKLHEAQI
jgi:hypothetical protein